MALRLTRRRLSLAAVVLPIFGHSWGDRNRGGFLQLVDDLNDGIELPDIDFPEPSHLFDIDGKPPVPLSIQLFQLSMLKLQSAVLQKQIEREADKLKQQIVFEIGDLKAGYLLKLNMYGDENGQAVIPGGQIVLPVGVGTEPLDALAELLRLPGLESSPPKNSLENFSSYLWLFKKNGKLLGRTIPKELRDSFEKRARQEAIARARLATWMRVVPDSIWDRVQRADYWQRVYSEREKSIDDAARRQRIKGLTDRMSKLQDEVNASADQYRDILRNMAEQNMALQAASLAFQLIGAINAAASSGELQDKSSNSVSTDSAPEISPDKMISVRTQAYESYRTGVRALEIEVQGPANEMKDLNDRILKEWQDGHFAAHPPEPPDDQLIPWKKTVMP